MATHGFPGKTVVRPWPIASGAVFVVSTPKTASSSQTEHWAGLQCIMAQKRACRLDSSGTSCWARRLDSYGSLRFHEKP
ncbi:hypothetical protein ACFX1X_013101 [Malus domestica]